MKAPHVLIVEDEHALALALAATLRRAGATSDLAPTGARAAKLLEAATEPYDLMLLDLGLPDQNGLRFLQALDPGRRPTTVVITAHGDIDNAITARKLGVAEFLTKPLDFEGFQHVVARLLRPSPPPPRSEENSDAAAFIGAAPTMRPVFQQIAHCCASPDPVLVRGPTGSGKSHAARVIRDNGPSCDGPLETLLAGPGLTIEDISQALNRTRNGTLIIEELGLLGEKEQAELLRHIEANQQLPRLIATTSENLHSQVTRHQFRSDLFYRLQILEVILPPLHARMADLPALVAYFLGRLEPSRTVGISDRALARLAAHNWPGNLRELRNALTYSLTVNSASTQIDESHLPDHLATAHAGDPTSSTPLLDALDAWIESRLDPSRKTPLNYRQLADTLEGHLVSRLLRRYDGKLARLSAALGANRTTLRQKLRRAGLTSD